MTALALTVDKAIAVQLAPQPITGSRLAIRPSTELTVDTMRSLIAMGSNSNGNESENSSSSNGHNNDDNNSNGSYLSSSPPRSAFKPKELALVSNGLAALPLRKDSSIPIPAAANGTRARTTSALLQLLVDPQSADSTPWNHTHLNGLTRGEVPASPTSGMAPSLYPTDLGPDNPKPRVNGHAPTPGPSTPPKFRKSSMAAAQNSAVPEIASCSLPLSTGASPMASSSAAPLLTPCDLPRRQRNSQSSAKPSTTTSELDPTAALIQSLYARLDVQGVPGDGWDEGLERTRDGLINREVCEETATMNSLNKKGKQVLSAQGAEEEEDRVLKRVDRYGFFSSCHPAALASQHNRLATLATSAFTTLPFGKRLSQNRSKANRPTPATINGRHSLPSPTPGDVVMDAEAVALETRRIDKWAKMLRISKKDRGKNAIEWDLAPGWWDGREEGKGKYRMFQRRVFKGVPDRWRRAVWGLEMERRAQEEQRKGRSEVKSLEQLKRDYSTWLDQPSAQDVQIDLDVPRTISGHVMFHTRYGQGQRALFHVLHAFGLNCDDVGGYCQGMGPIAATLLCYFEPEQAYAALVRLFDQYHLRRIFAPGFTGLMETFYVQERMVEWLMPGVHKAFVSFLFPYLPVPEGCQTNVCRVPLHQTEHMISTSAYATKWYITLFANSVPFATQLRLWDGLLLEGADFLIIVAVAIIWAFRDSFTLPSASFESILSTLSSYFFVESDDGLLRWIRKTLRLKGVRQKMCDWRVEWQGFVEDGSADRRVT
ncbi:BQ5605_C010g05949 [Microbotryum silenes-dioicae]|uniref:BQ5605_C010g05949 protein n=1 Tax=Microbotryum silenes-dioicae TaxID=796604 RepID=A0A2X0LUA3_9BASI|nr:BQ5605_C010g05949 [Microbotryum silenes-dioicae]